MAGADDREELLLLDAVFPQHEEEDRFFMASGLRGLGAGAPATARCDVIPDVFTGVDTYLRAPNIPCWFCDGPVRELAWFTPRGLTLRRDFSIESMEPEGCYCSIVCANSEIEGSALPPTEKSTRSGLLCRLGELEWRLPMNTLVKLPTVLRPQERLRRYGRGTMSEAKYVQTLGKLKKDVLEKARASCAPHLS